MVLAKRVIVDVETGKEEIVEEDVTLSPTPPEPKPVDLTKLKKVIDEIIDVDTKTIKVKRLLNYDTGEEHFNSTTKEIKADKFSAPNAALGEMEITTASTIHHGKSFSRGAKIIEAVDGLILHSPTKKWIVRISDEGVLSTVEVT